MQVTTMIRRSVVSGSFAVVILSAAFAAAADKKTDAAKEPTPRDAASIEEASAHIEKQLTMTGEVAYLDTSLVDVVNDLELRYKVDIELDQEALQAEGKWIDTLFTLQIKNVTLQSVLNRLLKQHHLTWTVADEAIVFTTKAGEASRTTVHVYSLTELAGSEDSIDYEEISEMLMQSVDPESWRTAGGSTGAIAKVTAKKSLVITQTYTNHRLITAILKDLSEK